MEILNASQIHFIMRLVVPCTALQAWQEQIIKQESELLVQINRQVGGKFEKLNYKLIDFDDNYFYIYDEQIDIHSKLQRR